MAALAVQPLDRDGVQLAFAPASAGGDTAPAGDRSILIVKNGSAASVTVTLATPGDVQGLAISDLAVPVPAGAETMLRLGPRDVFGDNDGNVAITYSASASVTVAAVLI